MGKSGSGKTSMRSFIFSAYRPEDTKRLGSTIEVEHSHVRFPGNLVLNLWDCGGQKTYMESYMDTQKGNVFSAVGALIYVVDLVSTEDDDDTHEWDADLRYFRVFCLLHKMDLIEPSRRKALYMSRVADLRHKAREALQMHSSSPNVPDSLQMHCFATSIWDASLFRQIEKHLAHLASICSASEIVLFERATFLALSYYTNLDPEAKQPLDAPMVSDEVNRDQDKDSDKVLLEGLSDSMLLAHNSLRQSTGAFASDRFERISELVKHFKIACMDANQQMQALEISTPEFGAYLDVLTSSTYILVVVTTPAIVLHTPGLCASHRISLFHSSLARNAHFDSNAFVERLEEAGIDRKQADVLVTALTGVINESIDNFARGLVDFAKLKSEIQLLERSDFVMMKSENERLMADVEKLKQRLREEITRTTAGVRLDLNLEKGRIRDESAVHALKIKEVDTRIESEIAGIRTSIQSAKFNVLQYLVGVATGAGALLLAYLRMFR
ncbi:Gtr1p [Malassezia vespertilionis]|uniref:GTP-binding protein n=1 Tax=Malassezia vespertilionis TaxID=2020962 RepID=A0A2N1JG76_9BASI|nr:Gtr1p [Malassezia vespertilionis]